MCHDLTFEKMGYPPPPALLPFDFKNVTWSDGWPRPCQKNGGKSSQTGFMNMRVSLTFFRGLPSHGGFSAWLCRTFLHRKNLNILWNLRLTRRPRAIIE